MSTKSPLSNLPGWARAEELAAAQYAEEYNTAAIKLATEQSAWRDTFPVDCDAEQLAADVVREQGRGVA